MIIKLFSIFFCINPPYRVLHLYTPFICLLVLLPSPPRLL
nr:MAG TPA: hypothetical protein [Caudoviricetes sp.]